MKIKCIHTVGFYERYSGKVVFITAEDKDLEDYLIDYFDYCPYCGKELENGEEKKRRVRRKNIKGKNRVW